MRNSRRKRDGKVYDRVPPNTAATKGAEKGKDRKRRKSEYEDGAWKAKRTVM